MSSINEPTKPTETADFSDEAMRCFLLGRLAESERANFEGRLFADDVLAERLRLAEFELTDDHAVGRLDATEREHFGKYFLVTAARREMLSVSQALRAGALAQAPARAGWREKWRIFFAWRQPVLSVGMVLAVLAVMMGAWWFTRPPANPVDAPQTARLEPTPRAIWPSPSTPTPAPLPVATPKSVTPPMTTPAPPPAPQPAVITALVLGPSILRDGGETARVTLPRGKSGILRLELELDRPWPSPYRAELLSAEGQKLATQRGKGLVFDFPARLLSTGDYQLKLSRINDKGQEESVGRYFFRVQK